MAGLDKRVASHEQALEGITHEMRIIAGGLAFVASPRV